LGGTGWRLPTLKELQSLVDYSQTISPRIDSTAISGGAFTLGMVGVAVGRLVVRRVGRSTSSTAARTTTMLSYMTYVRCCAEDGHFDFLTFDSFGVR